MNKENFLEEYEDILKEYLEDIVVDLKKENKEYKKLYDRYNNILNKNENLNWVIDGQSEDRTLNNKECNALVELIDINFYMKEIENKEIFYKGGREAYAYFKKIGIIK